MSATLLTWRRPARASLRDAIAACTIWYMQFDDEVVVNASIDEVWAIYSDVERWAEWTASIRSLRYVEGAALAVGSRVRIQQPKLSTTVWEVSAVDPGRSWTWVAKGPGVRTTASHTLEPVGLDATRVHQTLVQRGPIGAVLGRVYGRLTRAYLAMEAAGLRQRCEANASA
jgi:uncharacterized membrane protein